MVDKAKHFYGKHKHHCLSVMSIFVFGLHFVGPEFEAIGFAIVGIIASET